MPDYDERAAIFGMVESERARADRPPPAAAFSTQNGRRFYVFCSECDRRIGPENGESPRSRSAHRADLHNEIEHGRLAAIVAAAHLAYNHILELEDAWARGAISEHDGKGGRRSGRNATVRVALQQALDP